MAFVRVPIDLVFTPVERDQEVGFGIVLRGIWAKVNRTAALGCVCSRRVGILETASMDVAVGCRLRRADRHGHDHLELPRPARKRPESAPWSAPLS